VTTAVSATWARGPEMALTGAVERGDERTLEKHRLALTASPLDRLALYDALVLEQRRLVERRKNATEKRAASGTKTDC